MKMRGVLLVGVVLFTWTCSSLSWASDADDRGRSDSRHDPRPFLVQGRETFRFETFGDEAFWGDTLKLHLAIEGSGFGGVGPGLSPQTALAVGLKVDVRALPDSLV